MKNKLCLAAALATLLCSCSANYADNNATSAQGTDVTLESGVVVEPVIVEKTDEDKLSYLSHDKIGYGQGVQMDENNRPLGALDFNTKYGKYNAAAINDDKGKISLTFDQGYENGYTSKILDVLKEKNVKATFFVVQDYAERNGELVQRMIDEGHTVGNHSVKHKSMPTLSEDECIEEIKGLHDYIKENFDYEMNLFRPPMGEYSEYSLAVTKNCGYKTVLWSFAYADWDTGNQPDKAQSLEKLTNALHNGAIYLLHSVSSTNAEILADFIDNARQAGYEFE